MASACFFSLRQSCLCAILTASMLLALAACAGAQSIIDDITIEPIFSDGTASEREKLFARGLRAEKRGDYARAFAAYRAAADRGHPTSAYLVGEAYRKGEQIEADIERAAHYYAVGAVGGDRKAQYRLAQAFARGEGVPQDKAWASRWYGKAAYQGLAEAQFAYGSLLARGDGIRRNSAEAYKWLLLALEAGHPQAHELLEELRGRLSQEKISDAEEAVRRFEPSRNAAFADPPTVLYVQDTLNLLGYPSGPVDGVFGPRTEGALRIFQHQAGLRGEGRLTPETLRRLLAERRNGRHEG